MIVADTNVLAYLALPSPYTSLAEQLLADDPEWIAPALWRSEFRNVLALYLKKSLVSYEDALAIQSEMEGLMWGREFEVNSFDVLALVNQSDCSAYDCEFVALARSFQCKLVTMERRLHSAFPDTAVLLNDWVTGSSHAH